MDTCRQRVTLFGDPRWLRALALHPSPVLFADVEPADACQGRVGNCWLIAALSALAEFPAYFKNKIFITKKAGTKVRDNFRKVDSLFFDEELKGVWLERGPVLYLSNEFAWLSYLFASV